MVALHAWKPRGLKKGGGEVKLKCTIGKGKIARFGLRLYREVWTTKDSRNSREQRAKNTLVTRVCERNCERIALSLPVSSQWETNACWILANRAKFSGIVF